MFALYYFLPRVVVADAAFSSTGDLSCCRHSVPPGEYPMARTTLNSWRERLPNSWDNIGCWNDLFVWRNFIFSIVQTTLSASPTLTASQKAVWPAYVQDMPWTMLKFVSIARSPNRLREVSLALLMKLDNLPAMKNPAYATELFIAMVGDRSVHTGRERGG